MCQGISLSWRELPADLIECHGLRPIVRGKGEHEFRFLFRAAKRCLPVWVGGELQIVPWAGHCDLVSLEAGEWASRDPEPVDIPATFAFDRGVWYPVREGIRGVLVRGGVYMLTQTASHYYKIMTRSDRMPVLIGEQI